MAQAQHPQQNNSQLWQQRQADFVPSSRLSKLPSHNFSSSSSNPSHSDTPGALQQTEPKPANQHRTSFFSFGRHKSSASVQSTNTTSPPPAPPPQQQMNGQAIAGRNSSQLNTQQNPPPQQQQPQVQAQAQTYPAANNQTPASELGEDPQRLRRSSTSGAQPPQPPPLHPELRSFVSLSFAHVHKIYFSGPLVRKIERTPDGGKPKDDHWTDVWGQLGGTTLSIWEMGEIDKANKEGREVPPSYINVTDAFVSVLGSITVPPQGNVPPKRFTNVLTLNTAGANLILFACPDAASLVSWAAALRLAAWEKSRLEEIYTAHLLRMTLSDGGAWKEPKTTLVRGQVEGWGQVRVAGQTDWKRVWMVLSAASSAQGSGGSHDGHGSQTVSKGRRISSIFGGAGANQPAPVIKSNLALFLTPKMKDKKKPWLTFYDITQSFAVYPERPEMISKSTLIKVEGLMSDEEGSGSLRGREGWLLIMPELESAGGKIGVMEMLKWIVGFHDAFELYGRPKGYTWDPRDSISMMFAYPFGPLKDHLFLDRELAENLDPREDRTSVIRSRLLNVLVERMQGPPTGDPNAVNANRANPLPPLHMNGSRHGQGLLTPITELSDRTRENTVDGHFSPTDGELPRGISARSATNNSSPSLTAAAQHVTQGSPQVGGMAPASAVAPTEPPAPVRPSQAFEPLPPIPGSNFNTPPITPGESDTPPNVPSKGTTPKPVQAPAPAPATVPAIATAPATLPPAPRDVPPPRSAEDRMSPRSFARSLWSESPTSPLSQPAAAPGITGRTNTTSPEPIVPRQASTPQHRPEQPVRTVSPVSLERPPSLNNIPRSQSPLRNSISSAGQQVSASSQRVTSPLATSPTRPSLAGPSRPSLPTTPYREDGLPQYVGSPPFTPEKKQQPQPEVAPQSPTISQHSYPASAQMQSPDLIEPQPKPSRSSHAVLDAPFMNRPGHSSPTKAPASGLDRGPASQAGSSSNYSPQAQSGRNQPPVDWHATQRQRSPEPSSPSDKLRLGEQAAGGDDFAARRPPTSFVQETHVEQYVTPKTPVAGVRASQVHLQRKPSGARAPPAKKIYPSVPSSDLGSVQEDSTPSPSTTSQIQPASSMTSTSVRSEIDDYSADAALALADGEPAKNIAAELPPPPIMPAAQSIPRVGSPSYPSSFHNKAAADRKARAEAQHAAAQSAITKPGRTGGKTRKPKPQGAWQGDSEEEEDEEEDDDDEDSDGPLPGKSRSGPGSSQYHSTGPSMAPSSSQHLYQARRPTPPTARYVTSPTGRPLPSPEYASQQRGGRNLPVAPTSRSPSVGPHRDLRHPPQYDGGQYGEQPPNVHRDLSPAARGREMPPQLRQNMWSQALNPNQDHPTPGGRETFIKVEDEAETMTKVFAPQGLLHAGLQDKHDRSAKRQEEMARESGTSLINVPNKPLDPQTGLLGAVTAHERDRKRDGGVGATLTRKLADERMAEERQRKLDDLQRQQLDNAMGNGASMYDPYGQFQNPMMTPGGQFGYNPMMMNPMMMNPMMMGNPMMGNPMMGMGMGMNPQQMMAAQAAAAEAYQRAMVSFSQAGSQAPSEAGDQTPGGSRLGATSPFPQMGMLTPMMTGGMGGMPGMGMMGNPMLMGMMGMGMGMNGSVPGTPYGGPSPTSELPGGSRFNSINNSPDTNPQQPDRSASQSQQSHRASPPNGRANAN